MVVFLVGKDTLKISEAYINAFPAFSCPLFASKNPIVNMRVLSDRDGFPIPTAIGRLCVWWNDRPAATFATYSDFQKSLGLDCQDYESEVSNGFLSGWRTRVEEVG